MIGGSFDESYNNSIEFFSKNSNQEHELNKYDKKFLYLMPDDYEEFYNKIKQYGFSNRVTNEKMERT